jgi:hypothetical protein
VSAQRCGMLLWRVYGRRLLAVLISNSVTRPPLWTSIQ